MGNNRRERERDPKDSHPMQVHVFPHQALKSFVLRGPLLAWNLVETSWNQEPVWSLPEVCLQLDWNLFETTGDLAETFLETCFGPFETWLKSSHQDFKKLLERSMDATTLRWATSSFLQVLLQVTTGVTSSTQAHNGTWKVALGQQFRCEPMSRVVLAKQFEWSNHRIVFIMRSQLGGGQMAALKKQGLYQITLRALELKSRSNHTRTILDPHSRSTLLWPKLKNIHRVKFFKGFEFTPSSVWASFE